MSDQQPQAQNEQQGYTDEQVETMNLLEQFKIPAGTSSDVLTKAIPLLEVAAGAVKAAIEHMEEQRNFMGADWKALPVAEDTLNKWVQEHTARIEFIAHLQYMLEACKKWEEQLDEGHLEQMRLVVDLDKAISEIASLNADIDKLNAKFPQMFVNAEESPLIQRRTELVGEISDKLRFLVRPSLPAYYLHNQNGNQPRHFGEPVWGVEDIVANFKVAAPT